jgi:hypothetical protein
MQILLHLLTAGFGTNETDGLSWRISAHWGEADSDAAAR